MINEEIVQRSPVRIFENAIHGGLKAGELCVIASRKGVGKTAVMVQISLDKLFQGKKVIHVSFSQNADYVLSWYNDIFNEITKKRNVPNVAELKADIAKNRVLMNFNQDAMNIDQILRSLRALIVDGGFKAEILVIDGIDFSKINPDRFVALKKFASELGIEVWHTCTLTGEDPLFDKRNVPFILHDYIDLVDVLVVLEPKLDYIQFGIAKEHGTFNSRLIELKLDTKTLLIAEK